MGTCRLARWLGMRRWRDGARASYVPTGSRYWEPPSVFVLEIFDGLVDEAKKSLEQ